MNPSMGLKLSWTIISAFIDEKSLRKIRFIKKSDFPSIKEYFDPEAFEINYGGTLPKPTEFWPLPVARVIAINKLTKAMRANKLI